MDTNHDHPSETTSLLLVPSEAARRHLSVSYCSTANKEEQIDERPPSSDENPRVKSRSSAKRRLVTTAMILVSLLILAISIPYITIRHQPTMVVDLEASSSLLMQQLVEKKSTSLSPTTSFDDYYFPYAPNVVFNNTTTSFAELAKLMIPSWYQQTLAQIPVFSPHVMPDQVYKSRKIMLKTRDLIDVFAPVYPNETTTTTFEEGDIVDDFWISIRHYLNIGYMVVGEFQDLHNCHVLYTPELLENYRKAVLEWKDKFVKFHLKHDNVLDFLSNPASVGSFHHEKESHLFWGLSQKRPSAQDAATPCLQVLGAAQYSRALQYLKPLFGFPSVAKNQFGVHEEYHNLRKELRSLTDEFDLFGSVQYPNMHDEQSRVVSSMKQLKKARKRLGDLNDDWTAYTIYVEYNMHFDEQKRLKHNINTKWIDFLHWAVETNLKGTLEYLRDTLNNKNNSSNVPNEDTNNKDIISLPEFLCQRREEPTLQFVIGNEAGDADSIISAIALAYIESSVENKKTPIVSIPKSDFATQRPEVRLLLELAGVDNQTQNLIFVNDDFIQNHAYGALVTLVDHNVLQEELRDKHWKVMEIVDHHEDMGKHLDSCVGPNRTIAFQHGKALVASACTLVAERLKQLSTTTKYPADVGLLLLGVILLDSVNQSTRVGKVTQRDREAIQDLVENTSWQDLSNKAQEALHIQQQSGPDTNLLFELLQDAKYNVEFWQSLSVQDALRLDYKEYTYNKHMIFGISTVLMPLQDFFQKTKVFMGILDYMAEVGLDFLGIMFAYENDNKQLFRQLALCGKEAFPMDDLVLFLLHQSEFHQDMLGLKEITTSVMVNSSSKLSVRSFDQTNPKPSRKQIGPILQHFFESLSSQK